MRSTTLMRDAGRRSIFVDGLPPGEGSADLLDRYHRLIGEATLSRVEQHRLLRRLGSGGQGVVFLGQRVGSDGFGLPVALKIFSPEPYADAAEYDFGMGRMARVAARVALIQHDTLIDVHNFSEHDGLRLMEMEWVDGYDLSRLMTPAMLDRARGSVDDRRWDYLNDVVVTAGVEGPRLKPGIAIAVLRDLLGGLAALHREGVIHCDVKPSNVMLKRTGNAKLVDLGSAFPTIDPPARRTCTPSYAAPEVLDGAECSAKADLASLGYVLIELLSGARPFAGLTELGELLDRKRVLPDLLPSLLPAEVACNELLMGLVRGLIAPDPADRFPDAEAADLVERGAASFQRQLVKGDLASEYDSEIRAWLDTLD